MLHNAFVILGLEPTADGRAIRAAFVRLARIYHPDRFVDMPDDVRAEAERRMKEVTVAYEQLRESRRSAPRAAAPEISEAELAERKRKVREALDRKRLEEEQNRARWRRWDEIERQTRERQEVEARIAAMVQEGTETMHSAAAPPRPRDRKPGTLFQERMKAAELGETAPLAPRESAS